MEMIPTVIVTLMAFAGTACAAELQDRMDFPTKNGTVTFYHNNHVNEVKGDCKVCHENTPGKIKGFGEEYAHKNCIPCHALPDGPEGPTACDGCHKK